MTGQLIRTLYAGDRAPGFYDAVWNGTNEAGMQVGSGVYFVRLAAGSFNRTRKVVLLR
jgi:hypothetical protein